jgi:hypothetical protein
LLLFRVRVHGRHLPPKRVLLRGDLGESQGALLGDLARTLESRASSGHEPREGRIEAGADVGLQSGQDRIEQHVL